MSTAKRFYMITRAMLCVVIIFLAGLVVGRRPGLEQPLPEQRIADERARITVSRALEKMAVKIKKDM